MPNINENALFPLLARPEGVVDAVLDTDAYNEIDDQFAIAYMLRAPEKFNVREIYAAPFFNGKSVSPEDGMERSYDEILKILSLAGADALKGNVYKGSRQYLPDEKTPVPSPAAERLAALAEEYSASKPLYVIAIGAITNVASALLINPAIAEKIVVVWLGGHGFDFADNKEFNLFQDVAAARVVFGSPAPLVQLPCFGVVSHLTASGADLEKWLLGVNDLADYLARNTIYEAESYAKGKPWSRVVWDISTIAWFISDCFTRSRVIPAPMPTYDGMYGASPNPKYYRYVYWVDRDAIFNDLFKRLRG